MKAGYLTLGCRVNQYETEALSEALERLGFETAPFSDVCDVYVINTCAVTEESVRKSRQMVRRALHANPSAFVAVTGCASQLSGESFSSIPGVSFVCGTRNKLSLVSAVEAYFKGVSPSPLLSVAPPTGSLEPLSVTKFGRTRAYVKIQDGCRGRCSYCVIPSLRGDSVLRPESSILSEVSSLASGGCREVVLTGIETSDYGPGLSGLIRRVSEIPGIERIRLGSLDPSFFVPSFFSQISDIPSLCHHFHLSIQSGSDRILALMRRKYRSSLPSQTISSLRSSFPDMTFSADLIVGFPGETEEDFSETCSFAAQNEFLHLHIFTYSRRPGTEASTLPHQLPSSVKTERLHRLSSIGEASHRKILSSALRSGEPLSVLPEAIRDGLLIGHTSNFLECGVPLSSSSKIGGKRGEPLLLLPVGISGDLLLCETVEKCKY